MSTAKISTGTSMECGWSERWTKEEAEEQLQGFVFKGEGWYPSPFETILVQKVSETHYRFTVWYFNAKELVEELIKLPIHT